MRGGNLNLKGNCHNNLQLHYIFLDEETIPSNISNGSEGSTPQDIEKQHGKLH